MSPFKRAKNGRDAWTAIIAQYVGKDKWQKEVKKQEVFLHTFVWKGNSNMNLETFVNKHRTAFVRMEQCAEHITYTIPSSEQQVRYLLDGIQCGDPQLLAAIGNIKADTGDDSKLTDFEATAAYIIPFDPVTLKRCLKRKSGVSYDIAAVDLGQTKGETGVEICFHKPSEYRHLTSDQRVELKKLRMQNKGKKGKPKTGNKDKAGGDKSLGKKKEQVLDQMIAAFEAETNEAETKNAEVAIQDMVVSALQNISKYPPTVAAIQTNLPPAPSNTPASMPKDASGMNALKSILKRHK